MNMKIKKKKILFCSNTSFNIYNFRINLIKKLISQDYDITATFPDDEFKDLILDSGCNIKILNYHKSKLNLIFYIYLFFNYFFYIKKNKPDLIISYTIKPNIIISLVSIFLNVKIINVITGLGSAILGKKILRFFIILLLRLSLKKSSLIIFQNKNDLFFFIQNKKLIKQYNKIIRGSGLDTSFYEYDKSNNITNKINFIFIGRVIKDKGIEELVSAFNQLAFEKTNVTLSILGKIDTQNPSSISVNKIKDWEKSGNIFYLGYKKDVRSYISHSDCVILPSYREGLSRTLLEACSIGRPIITTNVPGCNDIVDFSNGFLCETHNTNDLLNKIKMFLKLSLNERIKMGINGRNKIILKFSDRIIIKSYLHEINNILKF